MPAPLPRSATEKLRQKFSAPEGQPNRIFEREVQGRLAEKAARAIGVDLVNLSPEARQMPIELLRSDLSNLPAESGRVDMVISHTVMEHLKNPSLVYREFYRVLRPGRALIFLAPNLWDYALFLMGTVYEKTTSRFHCLRFLRGWLLAELVKPDGDLAARVSG